MNKLKSFLTKENIALLIILVIAAFFRLYKIEKYLRFLGDEGRDVLVAYNILHGHLTLLGPTSSVGGFFLGPIYYYYMAPFLWLFNYNPVGPAVGVALIGILTVLLLYIVVAKFFNKKVALLASFLYAISPLVVTYSRSSWNPNPLPFVSLLTLFTVYFALRRNSLKLFAFSGFLLGIAMQLHYLALFLGGIIFLYLLFVGFYKSNFKKGVVNLFKNYLIIFAGFLIGWSPFIAFEIRHGFPDFKNITTFLFSSGDTGPSVNLLGTIYDVFFRIFGRLVFAYPDIDQKVHFPKEILNIWYVFVLVLAACSLALLFYRLYNSFKNKDNDFYKYSLLFFWLIIGIILFGFYKKAIYDYYFTFLFPAPFILVSLLLEFIFNNKKIIGIFSKVLVICIFVIILIQNLWSNPFAYPANQQLNQMRSIAEFVMVHTDAKPFNFALITGGNSDHAYRYFFKIWGHSPTTIKDPIADPKRETVTDQLFVVCESLPCEPLGNSLWEVAGFGRAEIDQKWNVSVVEIYKLVHYKEK